MTATESTQMTQTSLRRSSRIARRADEQGARPANVPQVAVEKLVTEEIPEIPVLTPKQGTDQKSRLLKGKKDVFLVTFNVRTLNGVTQTHELVATAELLKHDIICIQEHRFVHEDIPIKEHDVCKGWKLITSSAWKTASMHLLVELACCSVLMLTRDLTELKVLHLGLW